MYIFPILETDEALKDHIKDPEDIRKILHLEALLAESLSNLRKEIIKHGLRKTQS